MKLTRRELAALALVPGPASTEPRPSGSGLAQKPSDNPDDLLKAEAESDRRAAAAIAKVELAMSSEPAFLFKPL